MTAISRRMVKIWIVPTGTAASTLLDQQATAIGGLGYIAGEIKSYDKSGGEKDVESDPVFGGYVDKEKPISQFELSLEIVPRIDDLADKWDAIAYAEDSSVAGIYTSASETSTQPTDRAVFIEGYDGTNYKSLAYNNCSVTMLDISHSADDNRTYNITLKTSPTTETGVANFMTSDIAATALPAWSALDNN